MNMIAPFFKHLEKKLKAQSKYWMAVHLLGVRPQQYDRYRDERKNARSLPVDVVARMRKRSGMSWSAFGRLWDEFFLDETEKGGK